MTSYRIILISLTDSLPQIATADQTQLIILVMNLIAYAVFELLNKSSKETLMRALLDKLNTPPIQPF